MSVLGCLGAPVLSSSSLTAGSDVCTTSSYQASFEAFDRAGIGQADAAGLLRRSVQLAVQASQEEHAGRAGPAALVAYSCGSYGAARQALGLHATAAALGRPLTLRRRADGSEYTGAFAGEVTEEQLMQFHQRRLEVRETRHASCSCLWHGA